jgi:hypothetical protein
MVEGEEGGGMFLQNFGNHPLLDHMALQTNVGQSTFSPSWDLKSL